ncbi:hypothetical protein ACOME3_001058 [Neoechinorhynchus agilis]
MGSKLNRHAEPTPRIIKMLAHSANCDERVVLESYRRYKAVAPNGKMDKKTFIRMFKSRHENANVEGIAEILFKYFDADNSGYISFSEYFLPNALIYQTEPTHKANIIFDICDQDGNGIITIKELRSLIGSLITLRKDRIVSKTELDQLVKNVFAEMDADGSGKVDRIEFVHTMASNGTIRRLLDFNYGNY